MRRLAIAFVLLAAGCPKKKGGTTTTGDGTGGGGGVARQALVSWGVHELNGPDADPPKSEVFLAVTDETGAAKSYPVGTIDAGCASEAGGDMGALGTLRCWYAGGGANFIAVARQGELIVLRQWTDEGMEEPADYEEVTRVVIPVGAGVTFQP